MGLTRYRRKFAIKANIFRIILRERVIIAHHGSLLPTWIGLTSARWLGRS